MRSSPISRQGRLNGAPVSVACYSQKGSRTPKSVLAKPSASRDFQRAEQPAHLRHEMRQRGQTALGPIQRTLAGEPPLAARQQRVVERRARLPPNFPQLAQPAARFGSAGAPCFRREEIRQGRRDGRAALAGDRPRSIFHGSRCATRRIGIWLAWKPSASASASKSACSGPAICPRQNQRRAFCCRRKSPAARRMSAMGFGREPRQFRRTAPRHGCGQGTLQERRAERLQLVPRRDELRFQFDLRHAAKRFRRGEMRFAPEARSQTTCRIVSL